MKIREVNVMGKEWYYGVVSNYNRTYYLKSRVNLPSTTVFGYIFRYIYQYTDTQLALFDG